MPGSEYNAMQQLLVDIKRLYNNAMKYMDVCSQAIASTDDIIEVTLTDENEQPITIELPSFANIQRRMSIIEANIGALVGMQNGDDLYAQLITANNQVRTLVHMSLSNRPDAIKSLEGTIASDNNVVQLGNPIFDIATTLGMHAQIDVTGQVSAYMSKCQITKYIMSDDAYAKLLAVKDAIGIELTYAGFIKELEAANYKPGEDYDIEDFTVNLRARRTMSNGEFNLLFRRINSDGTLGVKFDTIQYDSTDASVTGSLELKVGDKLSTPIGDVIMEILSLDKLSQTAVLIRRAGLNNIAADVSKLVYVDDVVQKVVDLPIRHSEKIIAFLSPIHDAYNTIAAYSPAIFVDVANLTIRTKDNQLINANQYMLAYGDTNLGAYISAITTDMQPPSKYAIKPDKPQLNVADYKVIQLNTHLADNVDKERILKLYDQKRSLQQEISSLDSDISKLQLQLTTRNYSNESERKNLNGQYVNASRTRQQKLETVNEIVDQMLNVNSQAYDALYDPKFRIRGFLPVQEPSISRYTAPQNIVQFKVQYRYVSLNGTVAKADTFDVENESGDVSTATFSTWNEVFTPLRRKVIKDGISTWEPINAESIDAICCNQLDIPISPNETVQIRVKAIGEAGYPNILNESDWSNIMSMTFPEALAPAAQFISLKDELLIDKQTLTLENMLAAKGITEHIQSSITENNTYFAHGAQNIASGFYTSELARISAYEKMLEMSNSIQQLKDIIINQGSLLRVSIIDEQANESEILNGSITTLYAGAYSDVFDLTNPDNFGSVMSKQYWIKLTNIGTVPIDLYPKYTGNISEQIDNIPADYIYGAPISPLSVSYTDDNTYWPAPQGSRQLKGQLLYMGYKNVTGVKDLYSQIVTGQLPAVISQEDIDTDAVDSAKKYVQPNQTADGYIAVALKAGAESKYVLMSIKHPLYVAYLAAEDKTNAKIALDNEFVAMSSYNLSYKSELQQALPTNLTHSNAPKTLYVDNDKYLIGSNTRGAFLALTPTNQASIQVANSNDTTAISIQPGNNNSILIPLLFQARMTDAAGNIDVQSALDAAQFAYVKTVNMHTYIAGKEFVFDVKIYANFRSTSSIIGAVPISGINSIIGG